MIGFIYRILCIPTGKSYIGQTIDINRRKHEHFSTLRRNKHENPKLQKASFPILYKLIFKNRKFFF